MLGEPRTPGRDRMAVKPYTRRRKHGAITIIASGQVGLLVLLERTAAPNAGGRRDAGRPTDPNSR